MLPSRTHGSRPVSFTSAQPSHVFPSVFSTQTEELMQLDCSWASSGTTSNDITSICDVHHQQCLTFEANSKQTVIHGQKSSASHWKSQSDRAINLSISSTARWCAVAATWMGLLSKATDCLMLPGFAGNCSRITSLFLTVRIDARRVKTQIRLLITTGEENHFGQKRRALRASTTRVPPGWKDTVVKVTREVTARLDSGTTGRILLTHTYSRANTDSPSQFYSLCFYFFSYSEVTTD